MLFSSQNRVAKHPPSKKQSREYPTWYWRLVHLEIERYHKGQEREIEPRDFDEDLSELGEDDVGKCPCEGSVCDSDCELRDDDDQSMDNESEKSHTGTDAEFYYDYKEQRSERKRELQKYREILKNEGIARSRYEKEQEDKVEAAYSAFKKARRRARREGITIPLTSIKNQQYRLFSSTFVDPLKWNLDPCESLPVSTKRISFYCYDGVNPSPTADGRIAGREGFWIYGDFYLDVDINVHFGPLPLPTQARRKDIEVPSDCGDLRLDLRMRFFGDGFMKLKMSRDILSKEGRVSLDSFRETLEFVGILRDFEKEWEEWAERMKSTPMIDYSGPASSYNFWRDGWGDDTYRWSSWSRAAAVCYVTSAINFSNSLPLRSSPDYKHRVYGSINGCVKYNGLQFAAMRGHTSILRLIVKYLRYIAK